MIVLLLLYPVVFLFGALVQTPWLIGRAGLPFAVALFIGNVVSILSAELPGALDQPAASPGGCNRAGGRRSRGRASRCCWRCTPGWSRRSSGCRETGRPRQISRRTTESIRSCRPDA